MKHYYALFHETSEAIEVEFPDLPGCLTFGKNWEEAVDNAIDALAAWLAHAEEKFISPASEYKDLQKLSGKLIPIPIIEKTIESYQELKRFNVIFPNSILQRIDKFRKAKGLKRSTFLLRAAEEYLQHHT